VYTGNIRFAVYLGIALLVALVVHEYAHAWVADRRGDQTPRSRGRLTLNPRPLIDPFGSVILPGLALILVASGAGFAILPFAYAKPLPLEPHYLRDPRRDWLRVVLAGPVANLALAAVAGLGLRLVGIGGETFQVLWAFFVASTLMALIQLMPVPGFDGSKLLARVLRGRAREVYVNLDEYLVLFVLLLFFLLGGPIFDLVNAFFVAICGLFAGSGCPT
jgi:Zn-dependent protease